MTSGLLIVNKPYSLTSRDVVNEVSKIFKTKKIGHTGTLDPIATGVLVLTINEATKLSSILVSEYKEYIATALLGLTSDTLDITGNIKELSDNKFTKKEINNVLNSFIGTYQQQVPLYSAVKINGKKLYEYARNNIPITPPKRNVEIKEIELLQIEYVNNKTQIKFRCLVSKGTYIRSLINDIAVKLNTLGIMTQLIRTKQGKYDINNSYTLEEIKNKNYQIISIEETLNDYFKIVPDDKLEFKIKNGQIINNAYKKDYVLFILKNGYALYKNENNLLKPYKMLLHKNEK